MFWDLDELIPGEILIEKPSKNDQNLGSSTLPKDEKSNSGQIPSLVKYKLNPKSDEYSKWRVLKSQYMKLYPKEAGNMPGYTETKRRSQTMVGKQSIVNTSPDKFIIGINNTKDRKIGRAHV